MLKVVALMFLAQFALAEAAPQQRVLVLSSFAASDPVMEPVVRGLREVVSSRHGLELDVEYLDAEHDPDGSHLAEVSEYLSRKYGETNIDAIVALGEPALDFALDARGVSFNSVPVLFGEVHSL
ncbi:MAG: iron-containing alcohol dehydrogenase, partial [Gammaproteobacteria bacterium]|nr:iron-containing alcohol dehydrogenase [Gammaproteobacteria bacterium]